MRFAQAYRPRWRFCGLQPDFDAPQPFPKQLLDQVDGVISHISRHAMLDALIQTPWPVVDTASVFPASPVPRVTVDNRETGRQAATYLTDLGLKQFAFMGTRDAYASNERQAGFVEALAEKGLPCAVHAPNDPSPAHRHRQLPSIDFDRPSLKWMKGLPKPVGLFAFSDNAAMRATLLAEQLGISVPEQMVILGVDNDTMICETASPPLSSIRVPSERIGFEAASMLDRLIRGESLPGQTCLLPPMGVEVRQSTDVTHIDDPQLVAALRFIRHHAAQRITVDDVVNHVTICRSLLHRRFKAVLGRTPLQEIHRVRLESIQNLLAETDLSISQIADASGFRDTKDLHAFFAKQTHTSPTSYRRQHRLR